MTHQSAHDLRLKLTAWSVESIQDVAKASGAAVHLAVMLESVYWPRITNRVIRNYTLETDYLDEADYEATRQQYRVKLHQLITDLDPTFWRDTHKSICFDAARIDENDELYVLLRLANWT